MSASDVYVTEIVPKPHYNETDETYYMEALVCYIQLVEGREIELWITNNFHFCIRTIFYAGQYSSG